MRFNDKKRKLQRIQQQREASVFAQLRQGVVLHNEVQRSFNPISKTQTQGKKKNSNFYNQTDTNMRDQQIELHQREGPPKRSLGMILWNLDGCVGKGGGGLSFNKCKL